MTPSCANTSSESVVFASALEGWGFTALQVAKVLLPKFPAGTTPKKVAMILFGDFCLNEDEGKVTKLRDPTYPDGAIFPKLVLEPLWALSWVITWFAHDAKDDAALLMLAEADRLSHAHLRFLHVHEHAGGAAAGFSPNAANRC